MLLESLSLLRAPHLCIALETDNQREECAITSRTEGDAIGNPHHLIVRPIKLATTIHFTCTLARPTGIRSGNNMIDCSGTWLDAVRRRVGMGLGERLVLKHLLAARCSPWNSAASGIPSWGLSHLRLSAGP